MKSLFLLIALGAQMFGSTLSPDAVDAYATTVSDIFPSNSQNLIEQHIVPALRQIHPDHAKQVVKLTKSILTEQKEPITGPFVAGLILGINAAMEFSAQQPMIENTLAPADAPALNVPVPNTPQDMSNISEPIPSS